MITSQICDFCRKELALAGALLFGPPDKTLHVKKYHLCRACFKIVLKVLRRGIQEIEDILSIGPQWLNYTKKVKRKIS